MVQVHHRHSAIEVLVVLGPPVLFNFKSCNLAPARKEKSVLNILKCSKNEKCDINLRNL